jgi:hypothetical protein
MKRSIFTVCLILSVLFTLGEPQGAAGHSDTTAYPSMAPIDQYLMSDRDGEIAFARTAAPKSVSQDAEVYVLGPHGYEVAAKGKNGFVCVLERSWMQPYLMFWFSQKDHMSWGAEFPDSPVDVHEYSPQPLTEFSISVSKWSDGTPAQ